MSERKIDALKPDLAALLEAERHRPDPTSADQERLAARIESTVEWLALAGAATGAAAAAGAAAGPAALGVVKALPKWVAAHWKATAVAVFVAGGLTGAGVRGVVEARRARADRSLPAKVETVAVAVAPAENPVAQPAPAPAAEPPVVTERAKAEPRPVAKPKPRLERREAPAGGRDLDLAQERPLVEMARTSLARGKIGDAIEALRSHERQFPNGALAEERDSLWIHLMLSTGDAMQAHERARRFHERFPRSLLWPAIEAALSRSSPGAAGP